MIRISTSFLVHFALASALTMASSSCTVVHVTKVHEPKSTSWTFWLNPLNLWDELTDSGPAEPDTKAKGVRYFLPKPYILVTPLPEGKIDVSVVYLPDPDQEYAVDTQVYIASQNFRMDFGVEVDGEKSFLKKVTYEPKDPTIITDTVKAAGDMGKSIIDDRKAKKDAEEQKRKDAANKLDQLKTEEEAQKANVKEQEYLLELAERKLKRFNERNPASSPTPEKLTEKDSLEDGVATAIRAKGLAETEFKKSEAARKAFENRNPSASSSPADSPSSKQSVSRRDASLPGPALFEIKEREELLSLQLVKTEGTVESYPETGQMQLKTFMPVSIGTQGTGKKSKFRSSPPNISEKTDGHHIIAFGFFKPSNLESFNVTIIANDPPKDSRKVDEHELNLSEEGTKLTLKLPASTSLSGKWTIWIVRGTEEFEGHEIEFK